MLFYKYTQKKDFLEISWIKKCSESVTLASNWEQLNLIDAYLPLRRSSKPNDFGEEMHSEKGDFKYDLNGDDTPSVIFCGFGP